MKLTIRYSLRARQEEIELLEYILNRYGENTAKKVYNKIEKVLSEIASMPDMYRSSRRKEGLRKCVLSKQTSIYYRVKGDYLEIVSFRANRKDPRKFKI